MNQLIAIVGPTAVGKSALALCLAQTFGGEIVSADSRQVYRYMDIGTAKPPQSLLEQVPHHFINILNPDQDYSAGQYAKAARPVIQKILKMKILPLVVGGSGLYIRALVEGFFREEIKDPSLREKLQARLEREGIDSLYRELQEADPIAAEKIHPNNTRRVIRALEVYYAVKIPISKIQQENPDPAPFRAVKIGLNIERKKLYARINERVETMFEEGLVEEVRHILGLGYSPELNALNSVGYKEVLVYLQGEIDLFNCKELVKQNTRRYAKRQLTWFRAEEDIHWIDMESGDDFSGTVNMILDVFADSGNSV